MSKTGIIKGPSHENGGIAIEVAETGEHKEVEGGEYVICSEARFSQKPFYFVDSTNKEVLDEIHKIFNCSAFNPKLSRDDFIICKLTVDDKQRRDIKGTVAEILNYIQATNGCVIVPKEQYLEDCACEHKMQQGGPIKPSLWDEITKMKGGGPIKNQIEIAGKRGKEAFEKGLSATPIHDPVLMEMIKGLKVGEGADKILKAWTEAWHKENSKIAFEKVTSTNIDQQIIANYPKLSKSQTIEIYNKTLEIIKSGTITEADKSILEKYEGRGSLVESGIVDEGMVHQFYTPYIVCKKMWDLAKHYGFSGGKVLEPSAGTGRFFKFAPAGTELHGFDLDETNIKIASALYPQASFHKQEFETAFLQAPNYSRAAKKSWLPEMDLVIGNPPYGDYEGYYKVYMNSVYKRFEFLFIRLGLQVLKPGGLLIFIISQNLMNNGAMYNKMKKDILDIGTFVDAIRMPNGIFTSTQVGTDIVIFRKN